jgi:hypothetical protein
MPGRDLGSAQAVAGAHTVTRWTDEDLANFQQRNAVPKSVSRETIRKASPKFSNIRGEVNGKKVASKLEGNRYSQLLELERYGEIEKLRFQQPFPLLVGEIMIGSYVADFAYVDTRTKRQIVEDAKGVETAMFRWKAKHFAAQYGYEITIVRKA